MLRTSLRQRQDPGASGLELRSEKIPTASENRRCRRLLEATTLTSVWPSPERPFRHVLVKSNFVTCVHPPLTPLIDCRVLQDSPESHSSTCHHPLHLESKARQTEVSRREQWTGVRAPESRARSFAIIPGQRELSRAGGGDGPAVLPSLASSEPRHRSRK